MAKIYVVTKGCYSDYRIITATLDEEEAKKIAEKFTTDMEDAIVEVYENSALYLRPCYFVRFDKNGDVFEISKCDSEYSYSNIGTCCNDVSDRVYVYVEADNSEAAIEIASEKRAVYLARKAGIA